MSEPQISIADRRHLREMSKSPQEFLKIFFSSISSRDSRNGSITLSKFQQEILLDKAEFWKNI